MPFIDLFLIILFKQKIKTLHKRLKGHWNWCSSIMVCNTLYFKVKTRVRVLFGIMEKLLPFYAREFILLGNYKIFGCLFTTG
jgi:hypothetical protein